MMSSGVERLRGTAQAGRTLALESLLRSSAADASRGGRCAKSAPVRRASTNSKTAAFTLAPLPARRCRGGIPETYSTRRDHPAHARETREIPIEAHDRRVVLDGERRKMRIGGEIPRRARRAQQASQDFLMSLGGMCDFRLRLLEPALDHPQSVFD